MKIAIVTGASSGMGREFAKQISRLYTGLDEIWVIARRRDRLTQLQEESMYPLRTLDGDITDEKFLEEFSYLLQTTKPNVRMLVNAAGVGSNGRVEEQAHQNEELQPAMVRLNCESLLRITQCVLPYLSEKSRILNLASASAFCPQPGFAVYAATKSFVLSFSRALGRELKKRKIYVTAVCPGPVATEFFDADTMKIAAWKKPFLADPVAVVRKALIDSGKRKKLSVYGGSMKLVRILTKLLPIDFLVWIMGI